MKDVDWALFGQGIVIDEHGNDIIKKNVLAKELPFYARRLFVLGRDVLIQSPPELVAMIKRYAREVLEHYSS
ncbi:hypothetical protein EPA93_08780 [Ktedonosporobacter rubrisoli]|uniref:WYL domain-containing protein n=1 Tax=Ktedonosporobacter rubrisoli TaxID=2509675 RepID=A0A4P6JLH6_KTERU|nr:hypothetical protein [Ktedonosporobacter rubrisoli]QBD76097.1 hypothetical protein EPA93_08780 [Ktedonosporobacter rubrisoli]